MGVAVYKLAETWFEVFLDGEAIRTDTYDRWSNASIKLIFRQENLVVALLS